MTPDWDSKQYRIWDPCWCRWKGQWWVYTLARTTKYHKDTSLPMFLRRSHAVGFRSDDWKHWEFLGKVITSPRKYGVVNAGDVVPEGNILHLFLSHLDYHAGGKKMGQSLLYATSHNGKDFRLQRVPFEPRLPEFNTIRRHEETGEWLHSCRDPYLFHDPRSGDWFMYVTTGGHRWGVPPRQVVARSVELGGPWTVRGVALDDPKWKGYRVLREIERASVVYANGTYWMLAYGMYFSNRAMRLFADAGHPISRRSVCLWHADNPEGPFQFIEKKPILMECDQAGLYWNDHEKGIAGLGRIGWNQVLPEMLVQFPEQELPNV